MIVMVCLLGAVAAACSSSPSGTSANESSNALVQSGLTAERSGNTNQAFSDYKAALAKDPNNYFALYDLGYIYQVRGNTANASTEYRRVLLINPKFGDALYNLGVLEGPSDPVSAIAYYKQDLQVNPNNASANFNLGVLLIKQGQTSQGDLYLTTGLRLNPALSADVPPGITVPTTTTTTP
jgi:Tfp pilus assembly protein PilF